MGMSSISTAASEKEHDVRLSDGTWCGSESECDSAQLHCSTEAEDIVPVGGSVDIWREWG